jgi:hypothetical protein
MYSASIYFWGEYRSLHLVRPDMDAMESALYAATRKLPNALSLSRRIELACVEFVRPEVTRTTADCPEMSIWIERGDKLERDLSGAPVHPLIDYSGRY